MKRIKNIVVKILKWALTQKMEGYQPIGEPIKNDVIPKLKSNVMDIKK